jgi:hypothetical protein
VNKTVESNWDNDFKSSVEEIKWTSNGANLIQVKAGMNAFSVLKESYNYHV